MMTASGWAVGIGSSPGSCEWEAACSVVVRGV
jgi:hypothetical protein